MSNGLCAVVSCGRKEAGRVNHQSFLGAFISVPLCSQHLAEHNDE